MSSKTHIIRSVSEWNYFMDVAPVGNLVVLTDSNTTIHCLPYFKKHYLGSDSFTHWEINAGESNKTIEEVEKLWKRLIEMEADRDSILICLGGGMLTDLGGFVGSTFKRGIRTIYIPTTNLAMTDAAIGGKTGVNFMGFKNQIGSFHMPETVLIDVVFLNTLPKRELISGFAETIKHALIADEKLWNTISEIDIETCAKNEEIILRSMQIKQRIVSSDTHDFGIRQSLNFGHTIGHALEAISHDSAHPLLHGEAVIFGMLAELYLSSQLEGLDQEALNGTSKYLVDHFGYMSIPEIDSEQMTQHMLNDKKNTLGKITFSLISHIGEPSLGKHVSDKMIAESIDFAHRQLCNEVHSKSKNAFS